MSSGADCCFCEVLPGRWFYRLQRWPYGEWTEYDTYGPFASEASAIAHLDAHHANPGGWNSRPYDRKDLRFRCEWIAPSYDPSSKVVPFEHFADDLGYSDDDRAKVLALSPKGKVTLSPDHSVERIR